MLSLKLDDLLKQASDNQVGIGRLSHDSLQLESSRAFLGELVSHLSTW
jgi:hypothetical protein